MTSVAPRTRILRRLNGSASSPAASFHTRVSASAFSGSRVSSRLSFSPAVLLPQSQLGRPRSRSGRLHSNSNTAVTPAGVAPLGDARVPRKAHAAHLAGPAPGRTPASSTRVGGGKENQPQHRSGLPREKSKAQWEKQRRAALPPPAKLSVKKKPARVKTKPQVTVVNSSTVRGATYSNKDARDAYDEYRRGQLDPTVSISYKGIQKKYGIPKSVMSKLLTGKRALDRVGSGGGPMPHLTPVEERGVVLAADRSNRNGVKCLSKESMGAAVHRSHVERGLPGPERKDLKHPGRSYFYKLKKKHPDLKIGEGVPQVKEVEKHKMSQPEVVGHMFETIGAMLEEHDWPTAPKDVPAAPSKTRAFLSMYYVLCVFVCVLLCVCFAFTFSFNQ